MEDPEAILCLIESDDPRTKGVPRNVVLATLVPTKKAGRYSIKKHVIHLTEGEAVLGRRGETIATARSIVERQIT